MYFDPEKVPGIGELCLVTFEISEKYRQKCDKLFEDVDGLSQIFCAVSAELSDAYRIWDIYGLPYTSNTIRLAGISREEPVELLALWTKVLILRTVRLTDKSKRHKPVSVFEFLRLDLDTDLKKKVEDLTKITEDKAESLRTVRDQIIAHKDLNVEDYDVIIQKPEFTIHNIADILESVGNILTSINNHYTGDETYTISD